MKQHMNKNMNKEARERFEDLLKTDPNALTPSDIEFLKARSEYLTKEQQVVLTRLPKQQALSKKHVDEDGQPVNTQASAAKVTGAEVKEDTEVDESSEDAGSRGKKSK